MPELFVSLRWPDASVAEYYSPSSIIRDFFDSGARYSVTEFLPRARAAFAAASERVRETYGYPCARARATLQEIEAAAQKFSDPDATIHILDIRNP